MRRGRPLLVLLGAALVLAFAAPAQAQAQYAEASDEECADPSDSTVTVGQEIVVEGNPDANEHCFRPGSRVTVTLESAPTTLAVTTADSRGGYRTEPATIPSDTTAGTHTIRASGTFDDGRTVDYTTTITVSGGGAAGLPTTGRDIALLTLWGILLLGFGSVLISATWRRWRAAKVEELSFTPAQNPSTSVAAAMDHTPRYVEQEDVPNLRPVSTAAIPIESDELGEAETSGGSIATMLEEKDAEAPVRTEVEEVVQRASSQTSDLVSKLQQEIQAWSKPAE